MRDGVDLSSRHREGDKDLSHDGCEKEGETPLLFLREEHLSYSVEVNQFVQQFDEPGAIELLP